MTVASVWGVVQGVEEAPFHSIGDRWYFEIPAHAGSNVFVELWAEDLAGNQAYRAAIVELKGGTIKCVHWQDCGYSRMRPIRRDCAMATEHAVSAMRPFVCRRARA